MFARKSNKDKPTKRFSSIRGFFSAHFSSRTRSDSTVNESVSELMNRYHLSQEVANKELDGLGSVDGALLVECYGKGLRGCDIRAVRHMREGTTEAIVTLLHAEDALNRYFTTLLKEALDQFKDAREALAHALDSCVSLNKEDTDRIVFLHKYMSAGVRDEHLRKIAVIDPDSTSHEHEIAAKYLAQAEELSPLAALDLLDPEKPEYSRALLYLTTKNDKSIREAQSELADKDTDELTRVILKVSVLSPN